MSASVLGKGNASSMMDTDHMNGSPQVHLHFLTSDVEYKELGYGKVEFCCHGCGRAVLLYYVNGNENRAIASKSARDKFTTQHKNCPNHDFEHNCPDYRAEVQVIDLRKDSNDANASMWTHESGRQGKRGLLPHS